MANDGIPTELKIDLPPEKLAAFCKKWKIIELSIFGSALREDFGPDSDLDFLASFDPVSKWSLWDHAQMELELVELLGREVDLVSRRGIEQSRNWIRKNEILGTARTVYAA